MKHGTILAGAALGVLVSLGSPAAAPVPRPHWSVPERDTVATIDQTGDLVGWTVTYYGKPLCSNPYVWREDREIDCSDGALVSPRPSAPGVATVDGQGELVDWVVTYDGEVMCLGPDVLRSTREIDCSED